MWRHPHLVHLHLVRPSDVWAPPRETHAPGGFRSPGRLRILFPSRAPCVLPASPGSAETWQCLLTGDVLPYPEDAKQTNKMVTKCKTYSAYKQLGKWEVENALRLKRDLSPSVLEAGRPGSGCGGQFRPGEGAVPSLQSPPSHRVPHWPFLSVCRVGSLFPFLEGH